MTTAKKHYYAKSYDGDEMELHAFTSKCARDGFVQDGNRRFTLSAKDADAACMKLMHLSAREAVTRGFL